MRLDAEMLKQVGVFAFVSGQLVAFVGGAAILGQWLDGKFGTYPLVTGVLCVAGLVGSVLRIKQWLKK